MQKGKNPQRLFYLFTFLSGLSMSHHYTIGFLIFGFLYLIWVTDKKYFYDLKIITKAVFFFFLGLTPYLYLPWAASRSPGLNWGNPVNLKNFLIVISRKNFKNPLVPLSQSLGKKGIFFQFPFYLERIFFHFLYAPLFLAIGSIGISFRKKIRRELLFLLLIFFFTGPFFVVFLSDYPTDIPIRAAIMERFFLLSEIPLTIFIGLGIFWFLSAIGNLIRFDYLKIGLTFLLLLLCFIPIKIHYSYLSQKEASIFENYHKAVLDSFEPNSIFISLGDILAFGLEHQQLVNNRRKDALHIILTTFPASWYREQLREKRADLIIPEDREFIGFGPNWAVFDIARYNLEKYPLQIPFKSFPELQRDFQLIPGKASYEVKTLSEEIDVLQLYHDIENFWQQYPLEIYFENNEKKFTKLNRYPYLAWQINIRDTVANTHYQQGKYFKQEGYLEEALNSLKKATDLKKDRFAYPFLLGDTYFALGDFQNAAFYLEKAEKLNPHYLRTLEKLVKIYQQKQDLEKADYYLERLEKVKKEGGAIFEKVEEEPAIESVF